MSQHPASIPLFQRAGQSDRIAFDDQVEIQAGPVEKQVAHEAPDDVNGQVHQAGFSGDRLEQRQAGRLQGGFQLLRHVVAAQAREHAR